MSELGFNVLPAMRRDLGLKSHPKDRKSGGSILRSLDRLLSSVLSTILPPLLGRRREGYERLM